MTQSDWVLYYYRTQQLPARSNGTCWRRYAWRADVLYVGIFALKREIGFPGRPNNLILKYNAAAEGRAGSLPLPCRPARVEKVRRC
jgi:hypothetical protein